MATLEQSSGPWSGLWIQGDMRGTMKCTLQFSGGTVCGGGRDRHGSFTLDGTYDAASAEVVITKRYPTLIVIYRGVWDGTIIAGTSSIIGVLFYDQGAFELWPDREEKEITEFIHEREEVKA